MSLETLYYRFRKELLEANGSLEEREVLTRYSNLFNNLRPSLNQFFQELLEDLWCLSSLYWGYHSHTIAPRKSMSFPLDEKHRGRTLEFYLYRPMGDGVYGRRVIRRAWVILGVVN